MRTVRLVFPVFAAELPAQFPCSFILKFTSDDLAIARGLDPASMCLLDADLMCIFVPLLWIGSSTDCQPPPSPPPLSTLSLILRFDDQVLCC
jgi:hypothetical protein